MDVSESQALFLKFAEPLASYAAYRDFAAVLKEMEAKAKDYLTRAYEHRSPEGT